MRELKGWHVLTIMLVFFGVTISVNTIFVTYALSTFAGEDVKQPYLKGLEYNRRLDAKAAQATLGWSAVIAARRQEDGRAVVTLRLLNAEKKPLSGLEVDAILRYPVNARLDRTVSLQSLGDGVYEAKINDLARGQWDVIANTRSTDNISFAAMRRVMLP